PTRSAPRIQPPTQSALLISQGTEGPGRAWQSEGQIVRRWGQGSASRGVAGQGSASRGGAAQREPGRGEQGKPGEASGSRRQGASQESPPTPDPEIRLRGSPPRPPLT